MDTTELARVFGLLIIRPHESDIRYATSLFSHYLSLTPKKYT